MGLAEGAVADGDPVLKERPEPGGDEGQAVSLALQKRFRVQRKRCTALWAELAINDRPDRLARDRPRKQSRIASVVPQVDLQLGWTQRTDLTLLVLFELFWILKKGIAVNARYRYDRRRRLLVCRSVATRQYQRSLFLS